MCQFCCYFSDGLISVTFPALYFDFLYPFSLVALFIHCSVVGVERDRDRFHTGSAGLSSLTGIWFDVLLSLDLTDFQSDISAQSRARDG